MGRSPRSRPSALVPALAALLLSACRPEDTPPVASEVLRDGVDMAIIHMRTFVTREGVRRALLEADTAEFVGETEIHMRPVKLTFYDHDGSELSVITADTGIYYELSEDMQAEGTIVVLDRRDDQRLETERLRYENLEDRLFGDLPFTLWSDDDRTMIQGSSFESDPGLDSVTVISPSGRSEQRILGGSAAESAAAAADSAGAGAATEPAAVGLDSAGAAAVAEDTTGGPAIPEDTTSAATPADTTSAVTPADTMSTVTPADTTAAGVRPRR